GYMSRRRVAMTPSDAEQVVTIDPELVISGRVTDAATGRPVVGRIVLHAASGVHLDWRRNRPATIVKARGFNPLQGLFGRDPRQNDCFAASLDKDGRFRVEDVPPGHYELTVTIDAPPASDRPGPVQALGQVKVPVAVPQGDDDLPVDLGTIEAEIQG
ncbi:MAG TPA: carboxypeptidase-like regulatory domain-containing protein, partial [Isosphaeraceae bacterium]|nr:carboxypeptidase-like regulatory domain-containing protein [Isosphaeraceae bacterium]